MLFPRLVLVVLSLVTLGSCSKKAKNETKGEYVAAVLSEDAIPAFNRPTRPDGGAVEGKIANGDPEEAENRRNKNLVEPIVFGQSVANISMTTSYSELLKTLVLFGSDADGYDYFGEHIVALSGGGADPLPQIVYINSGYAGKLTLPAPYGDVSVGQSMANFLVTFADLKQFMLILGAAFENQPIATYDCEKSLTCQQNEYSDYYALDFKRGGIYLSKQEGLPIGFIYFTQPQKFYATLIDPMIHGLSIGGLSFQTKRTTAELRLGPTIGEQNEGGFFYSYYDRANFAVEWGTDGTPRSFKAVGNYQGPLNFGTVIGSRKLGESFSTFGSTTDNGTQLMLAMDRDLNKRAPNYDCSTPVATATCQVTLDAVNNRLLMVIDRSVYSFSNTPERIWLSVGMIEP